MANNVTNKKLYIYNNYGNSILVVANSSFEAFGLIRSKKDENNVNKYYCELEDIKEVTDINVTISEDFKIIECNNI